MYFDNSALVKLAVDEDGSGLVDELWRAADRKVSSHLVYPEARAALVAAAHSIAATPPRRRWRVERGLRALSAVRLHPDDFQGIEYFELVPISL